MQDVTSGKPLLVAAFAGDVPKIHELLKDASPEERPAILNDTNSRGATALHVAVNFSSLGRNRLDAAKVLLDYGSRPDMPDLQGVTPLHMACCYKSELLDSFLAQPSIHLDLRDKKGTTPLHLAIVRAHVEGVETLLARGADIRAVTDDGLDAINLACLEYERDTLASSKPELSRIIELLLAVQMY
jgi:ankyrin repeat protein